MRIRSLFQGERENRGERIKGVGLGVGGTVVQDSSKREREFIEERSRSR